MTHPKGLCIHVLTVLLLFMPVHASERFFVFNYDITPSDTAPFKAKKAKVEITCPDLADQPQELPDSSASTSTGTIQITTILTNESEQSDTASSPAGNEIRRIQYSLQPLPPEQGQDSAATHALLNHDGELIEQVTLDPFTLQLLEDIETPLTPAQLQQSIRTGTQPFFLALLPALTEEGFQTQYPIYQTPEPSGSGDEEPPMELTLQTFPDRKETAIIQYGESPDQQLVTEVTHIETSTSQFQFTIILTGWKEFTVEASDTETSESETSETLLTDSRYASGDSQDSSAYSPFHIRLSDLVASLGLILATIQLSPQTKIPSSSSFFRDRSSSF